MILDNLLVIFRNVVYGQSTSHIVLFNNVLSDANDNYYTYGQDKEMDRPGTIIFNKSRGHRIVELLEVDKIIKSHKFKYS